MVEVPLDAESQDGRGSLETAKVGAVVGAASVVLAPDDAETVPEDDTLALVDDVMDPEELTVLDEASELAD